MLWNKPYKKWSWKKFGWGENGYFFNFEAIFLKRVHPCSYLLSPTFQPKASLYLEHRNTFGPHFRICLKVPEYWIGFGQKYKVRYSTEMCNANSTNCTFFIKFRNRKEFNFNSFFIWILYYLTDRYHQ